MPPTDDIDALRQMLTHAEAVIAELRGVVAELRRQVEAQQARIHRLVKRTFGPGGERVEGPTLFDGIDLPVAEVPPPAPPVPDSRAPRKWKGHGRRHKPADLPRRREEIDLTAAEKLCACCGAAKIRIGQVVSERLEYQPMALFVRELVRPTYACRTCESQGYDPRIARATLPPEPIPKSGIGSGLLAHVIVSKFVDHLPLHRQEATLARHGWDVRRSTLCDHLRKCGELLTPLYDRMRQRLLRSFAVYADDMPLVLLRPRRAAYAWVYLGDESNPYTLFDLTAGRRQEFPQRFLAGYRGFVHADAYDGYNGVHDNVRHLGCWMHARRYFVDAGPSEGRSRPWPSSAPCTPSSVISRWNGRSGARRSPRPMRCGCGGRGPGRCSPRSPTGSTFNTDPPRRRACSGRPSTTPGTSGRHSSGTLTTRFALDNGAAKRAIRPLAVGRSNWLHVGGDAGLKTASVLLSVCASAARHGLDPWSYLRVVFDGLARRPTGQEAGDLLPDVAARSGSRVLTPAGRRAPPAPSAPG